MIRLHVGSGSGRQLFTSAPFTQTGTVYINHNMDTDCVQVYLFAHGDSSASVSTLNDYYRNDYWVVNHEGWAISSTDLNTIQITFYTSSATTQVIADIYAEEAYPR